MKSRVKIVVDGTLLVSSLIPEDSGTYTCMPTNGLLTPPTASANLTVMHPAQALKMPQQTYLPTGMDGVITCPVAAQPPLLYVDWTKDGEPLDLSLYPGWTLTPEGSLFMATVNDDTAGVYTCTPYNSYGSMGSSGPTNVILQDPPSFSVTPEKQYKQEAGSTLIIPCQGNEDPTNKVTWSKVDLARRASHSTEPNGSLLLQPLTKEHQGTWECCVTNRVASVKTSTEVFVLGTSPHAATSLSVSPGVKEANISWEAGFDGGSAQTFSVWVKKISASDNDGKRDWFSVSVPPSSGTTLQVTGLSPATDYQFSILSINKMGTGPFSEITTTRTLDPPPMISKLNPPASLSANQGSAGVVLQWSLSEAQLPPITGFVLQARTEQGEWFTLDEDISANMSEIVVPGLRKDCVYELRLLSRRGELLSEPSPSVNVSTVGMEIYPATSQLLEFVPEPLLAGILGGVGFMCLALVLLLGSACVISYQRDRRRRKKKDEHPPAIYKYSPSIRTSGTGSPDSVLKKSVLPASILYPTTSSTDTSSSSQTECSSFSTENHQRRKHILSNYSSGRLTRTTSSPISPPIELISRGPDGRFLIPPYDNDTLSLHSKKSIRYDQPAKIRRSLSLHSEREDRKEAFVLSVDLPPCKPAEDNSRRQICDMAQRLPHRSPYILDQKASYDGFPDFSSMCSNSSLATIPNQKRETLTFPVLPHIRSSLGQPSTTASALVLQMEHERERGNLSHCLKLAQEREEIERELRKYTLERSSMREMRREHSGLEEREAGGGELLWEYKSSTLPHRYPQGKKESFDLSPSPFSLSSVHWEDRPFVSPSILIPAGTCVSASSPASPSCFKSFNHHPAPSFTKQTPLQPEEAGSFSKDRLTPPHLPSKHQRHERVEAAPEGYDNSPQSTLLEMQTNDSCSEARRQNNLSHGSLSTLSLHSNKYPERSNSALDSAPVSSKVEVVFSNPTDEDVCVEMSVDEPELEVCVMRPTKPMLHHRIASHVQRGHSLTRSGRYEDTSRGSASFNCRSPASVDDIIRVPDSSRPPQPELWRAVSQGSKTWDSKRRSQSLDSRRRKESNFLPPDAWIDSLSQENCSVASSRRPESLFWEPQKTSLPRKISKSPANSPPATKAASRSPPAVDPLSLRSNPERPISNPCHYEPRRAAPIFHNAAKWPIAYQEAMKEAVGSLEAMKEASRCLPPGDNDQDVLEVETGCYEGVPESGSSYSSYASSGRGSMEPANGRLSMCHLSPVFTNSPETVEESTEDSHQMEPSQRRKVSVDENYEWDAADFCSQPGDHDGLLPSLNLPKPARCCSLPSMQCSTKALKNCAQLSLLPGHRSSCSTEPEPDTVLF
ncbi:Protein turtle-like protein A [Larimichthys crocea]|uniref:Protein turtle-like protein A n=2 Tax=Larimichthys crocea TaxID=215358 RepID=A0A6G0I091_LARCR|nr:Protein turtle-like protein A [Larimichthys crocea]